MAKAFHYAPHTDECERLLSLKKSLKQGPAEKERNLSFFAIWILRQSIGK